MRFIRVREEHLELILQWRTSEHVTKFMYTDIDYDLEKQKRWYKSIADDPSSKYWIICSKDRLVGLVSINQIDWPNRRAYWAYYIGDPRYSMIGPMVGPYLYNYVFAKLGLNKLLGEVLEDNGNVRRTHLMHGCREVGFYKEHVYKYGKYHNVYIYEMLAEDWNGRKEKYGKYVGEFED